MASTEESTVRLYHRLEDGLGKDVATVLVENFATKQDIADLRAEMATKTDLDVAISGLELRLYRAMFTGAMVLIATNVALFGSLVAVGR